MRYYELVHDNFLVFVEVVKMFVFVIFSNCFNWGLCSFNLVSGYYRIRIRVCKILKTNTDLHKFK